VTTPPSSRGGGTPPRPPAARPQQWFTLRPWLFDVTAATGLLRAAPRQAQPLSVQLWARAYGLLPGGSPHTVSLLGPGPGFDPYYAMTTDLDQPVIIATLTSPDGEPAGPLLIDGYALPVTAHSEGVTVADGGCSTGTLGAGGPPDPKVRH
jgi:hypothetical protein